MGRSPSIQVAYYSQFETPHFKKVVGKLGKSQKQPAMVIKGLESKLYGGRLKELAVLEKR